MALNRNPRTRIISRDPNQFEPISTLGAVVLCGGQSTRLGVDKAALEFRGQTFLKRVVEAVGKVTDHIVLVGRERRDSTAFSKLVQFARDQRSDCGPLEGIRVGLKQLADVVPCAFVTSCDVPLLKSELIQFLFEQLGDSQAVIPIDGSRVFGMTAIYRTELHTAIDLQIQQGKLRVSDIAEGLDAKRIDLKTLSAIDPQLDSFTNINSSEDYLKLLARSGTSCSASVLEQLRIRNPD